MHKRKWLGSGLLLVTAIVWGFCFVVQRTGMDYVGPFTYGASRFLLGAAALLPLTLLRRPDRETRRRSIRAGVPCGVLLFLGLTAWDTQSVKKLARMHTELAMRDKLATMGAMNLYLDFINLFLFLLRIFGGGRD